jgi:hypothetical protein
MKARRRLGGEIVPYQADAIGWLDALSLVEDGLANGDPVTTWTSRFNAATASGAQSGVGAIPTFVANVDASGKPGVSFNGTSDYMILGDAWKLPPAGKYTLYLVARRSSTASTSVFSWASTTVASGGTVVSFVSSSQTGFRVGGTASPNLASTWANNLRAVATLTNVDAGAGFRAHVNATEVFTTGSNGSTTSATRPLLGARWTDEVETGAGLYLNGTIQAVLAYSTEHGATERATVHAFLYDRYGVAP